MVIGGSAAIRCQGLRGYQGKALCLDADDDHATSSAWNAFGLKVSVDGTHAKGLFAEKSEGRRM